MPTKLEVICWRCGHHNNGVAPVSPDHEDIAPQNGDVLICTECCAISFVDSTREENLRKPEPRELDELLKDPELQVAVLKWWAWKHGLQAT